MKPTVFLIQSGPGNWSRSKTNPYSRNTWYSKWGHSTVFTARQASAIGQHIEDLYDSIGSEDVGRLKAVVHQLREESSGDTHVADVANRLDKAIGVVANDDLEEVLSLASEVMQICRESRITFVDAAESIVGTRAVLLDVEK